MKLINSLGFQLALLFVAMVLISKFAITKDSTDPENGVSGMALYTDAMTGCQYLSAPFGNLIPRLDRNGKQICGANR